MASIPTKLAAAEEQPSGLPGTLLVSLAPLSATAFESTIDHLNAAFEGQTVLVATPDMQALPTDPSSDADNRSFGERHGNLRLLTTPPAIAPGVAPTGGWVLTAADFVNAFKWAQQHQATGCLLLGAESQSLSTEALRGLANAVTGGADLTVARYDLGPRDGLVNSAILYPISRAVYGARPRFPLAIDLGFSMRMAERMATAAQRFTASSQNDALVWPVAEAAVAGFSIAEVPVGARTLPAPTPPDLNSILGRIAASLFSDVEARAAFWQRSRLAQGASRGAAPQPIAPATAGALDIAPMLDSFRIAYTNLHEIWSLVLPPQTLLGLKRLAASAPGSFRMPDALWARIVYDFLLAFRLRTLNRGHLLGALTPLYLGWVASHILLSENGTDPERHVEEVVQAFEFDKPYMVSRWRWPDRFNP